mmetsp:Transcript_16905/g.14792  ORF Transcript_16905/g.14792 Transcript_16905/m.14792 type:complete len:91 (-) Transcript_16905:1566-1838(-)
MATQNTVSQSKMLLQRQLMMQNFTEKYAINMIRTMKANGNQFTNPFTSGAGGGAGVQNPYQNQLASNYQNQLMSLINQSKPMSHVTHSLV